MTTTLLLHPKMWQLPPLTKVVTHKHPVWLNLNKKIGCLASHLKLRSYAGTFFQITCRTITSKQQFNTILIKASKKFQTIRFLSQLKFCTCSCFPYIGLAEVHSDDLPQSVDLFLTFNHNFCFSHFLFHKINVVLLKSYYKILEDHRKHLSNNQKQKEQKAIS